MASCRFYELSNSPIVPFANASFSRFFLLIISHVAHFGSYPFLEFIALRHGCPLSVAGCNSLPVPRGGDSLGRIYVEWIEPVVLKGLDESPFGSNRTCLGWERLINR